jgi:nucleoside-diphosphate-sugar epimerase
LPLNQTTMTQKILIIGACGQIGSELTYKLRSIHGDDKVIASDINYNNLDVVNSGLFEIVDAQDYGSILLCVEKHNIDTIYLMAAMLSATGEKYPMKAWDLNMDSLFHVLNLAKAKFISKVFWPSSIAVFGPTTPKDDTPQHTIMAPTTVYGITKQVGERWCEYYFDKYGVDVRSIRYPGIISWKTMPGGGTTDYAVEIFHKAITDGRYESFLSEDTQLPMMYMDDAIDATIQIMNAPANKLTIRSSYNLAALSFTPKDIANEIQKYVKDFIISYNPDFRQQIADTWPRSIDDSVAKKDWNWSPKFDLKKMSDEMMTQLGKKYAASEK